MKKTLLLTTLSAFCFSLQSQTLTTTRITDWNNLRKSGFYESLVTDSNNLPTTNHYWFWGINIAHTGNIIVTDRPYYYGGQILFGINNESTGLPLMYIRSTNVDGQGNWAKVITDIGPQTIRGDLSANTLSSNSLSTNTLKTVLARLSEGSDQGEGTFLGVKSYYSQVTDGYPDGKVKSFSLEHKFYGKINSSIDFFRGSDVLGGYIGISVNDGTQVARFNSSGLEVGGTIKAREVNIEIAAGADHVFNHEYELKPLSEVEAFVKENKHLPEIQSEKQMQEDGLNINEFQMKLLQKIEELTLYVIEQDKTIKEQGRLIENLQNK